MGQNRTLPQIQKLKGICRMMWECVLWTLTILVNLLPLFPAIRELISKKDAVPLAVDGANDGDVKFFARNFELFIRTEIDALNNHKMPLNSLQNYCIWEDSRGFRPTLEEWRQKVIKRVLISYESVVLPDDFRFEQEIYSKKSLSGGRNNGFHAILAKEDLFLAPNSQVVRWAHAKNIYAEVDCKVFGRLSADDEIQVKPQCRFRRMSAPVIKFVETKPVLGDKAFQIGLPEMEIDDRQNFARKTLDNAGRWIVNGALDFPSQGRWNGDIVVKGDARIHPGARIGGSLKVYGNLLIGRDTMINGAVISKHGVFIGKRATVDGPVLADDQIIIDQGSEIGTDRKPASVCSPLVLVASNVHVWGTVHAREMGMAVGSLSILQ